MRRIVILASLAVALAACGGSHSGTGDGGPADGRLGPDATPAAPGSVVTHHNGPTRQGVYTAPALTRTAAAGMHLDPTFQAPITGNSYAQPLYLTDPGGGPDLVIAATESDNVYGLDAADGSVVWQKNLGDPVPLSSQPCGDIDPLGITGTPAIDPVTRTIYLDAMTTPDGGTTDQHMVFALDADTGDVRSGWPVDLNATITGFDSTPQNQRSAILLQDGHVYVAFGGHAGDCGGYHGWLIDVPVDAPQSATGWATRARGGGSWAPGGPAGDGSMAYITTGNTFSADTWMDGEAVIRFAPGPTFSDQPADYYVPSNWKALDDADLDLSGQGPVLFDLPGATPAHLVLALGKDGLAYLLDRDDLGGISDPVASASVSTTSIIGAGIVYRTAQGTYAAFNGSGDGCPSGQSGGIVTLAVTAGAPPQLGVAWCTPGFGRGAPLFTTSGGGADPLVWWVGTEGDDHLHAVDADTGEVVFDGGGASDKMGNVRRFSTPMVAKGRVFVAGDGAIYAFTP
jgi:outer membrane protein assembly factor BamB